MVGIHFKHRSRQAFLLGIGLLWVALGRSIPCASADPVRLSEWPEGLRGAEAQSVVVVGDLAYIAGGYGGLFVVNVADRSRPVVVGRQDTAGFAKDVFVSGTTAYVADSENGLVIIDTANPGSMAVVGTLDTDGLAEGVSVAGNFAYVADSDFGVVVVNVANPAAPFRAAVVDTIGRAGGVQVVGSKLYVANGNSGIRIYDVANPQAPALLGALDTAGFAGAIQVSGSMAYVADGPGGMRIVDVSMASAPAPLGGLPTAGIAVDVKVRGTLAAVTLVDGGVQWVDVSNPLVPVAVGSIPTRGAALGMQISGSFAYIADAHSGLVVADISTPSTPLQLSRTSISGEAQSVQVQGTLAYVADWNGGLAVINVSNPEQAFGVSQFSGGASVADVQVVGSTAYVADYLEGLVVLDVSNPAVPVRIGGYPGVSRLVDLQVVGNRAYLAHGGGLEILDISTPASPARIGGFATDGEAFRVQVSGTTAYLGLRNSTTKRGFQVINVASSAAPTLLGGANPGGAVSGIFVTGTQAFVAASEAGLQVLNVANPAAISTVGSKVTIGAARGVSVLDGKAFVAEDDAGFSIFDVRNAANPVRTSLSGTRGHALGIHLTGALAYVSDSDGGLAIFTQATPINTPPVLDIVPDAALDELAALNVTLKARDFDVPANTLAFSLQSGPAGMNVSPAGLLTWIPTEGQGPSTHPVVVKATDNGVPPMSATRGFQVIVRELNSAPQMAAVGPQTLFEQVPWTLPLSVQDADLPPNLLTYQVLNGPDGLSVNGAGLVSWTPTEAQGPSVGTVVVKVTDNGVPPLSATNQFSVQVNEVNTPPVLPVIAQQEVNELEPFDLTLAGADADLPANVLSYALLAGPPGLVVSPAGRVTWVPSEAQGPSLNPVVVTVTDNGVPPLSATNEFAIAVGEVNTVPTLATVSRQDILEGAALEFLLQASDADIPPNVLSYGLVSGPEGMTVSGTGLLNWTPTEAQGPSTNTVLVRVSDNGSPLLSATNPFVVVVLEINQAPVFSPVGPQSIPEQLSWSMPVSATDGDLPANVLVYALVSGPPGVAVSGAGLVTWTPTEAQGPSENTIVVKVTDDGSPPLSATNQFNVTVNEVNQVPALAPVAVQTVDALVPLALDLSGSDPDLPANPLQYILVNGPVGLTVGTSGDVRWTPGPGQAPSTNRVIVAVLDSGTPPLGATNEFLVVALEVEERAVVQVGIDDDPRLIPYLPYGEFTSENNINDLAPGGVSRLPQDAEYNSAQNPGRDDDFYVRGIYPPRFNGLTLRLLVPNDEPSTAWEHSLTNGDLTNRLHFRLTQNQAGPGTWIRLVAEFVSGGSVIGANLVPGFGDHDVVVRFRNGDGLVTTISSNRLSAPGILKSEFPIADVKATAGANSIEFVRTGPSAAGTAYWVTFDYVRMEVDAGGNQPPVFTSVPPQTVLEGGLLSLPLEATDGDVPPTPLVFALVSGPPGLTVSALGVVGWSPTETQGPSTNTVVVQVTDNGVPQKSTTHSLTVVVQEVNAAPVPDSVARQVLPEQVPWFLQLSAVDPDVPANQLTYALINGPSGLVVSASGLVSWTPREAQGPSENTVTVRVTDNGVPPLSATNPFAIGVFEVNLPPVLPQIPLQTIDALVPLVLQLDGTDPDLPVNGLRYGLVSGPDGLTVDPSGRVLWTPGPGQAPSTNRVVVQVTDSGEPLMTVTSGFFVVALVVEERAVIQIGIDDDPAVLPYVPFREFQPQNNLNDLPPGRVTRLPGDPEYEPTRNPGRDDDFYVRGIYPRGFNALTARLLVPNDEPSTAWEHSMTLGDRTNRLHFRLSADQAATATWIRFVTELADGGSLVGGQLVPGFADHDIDVRFRNGVGVETVLYSGRISEPSVLKMEFPISDVQATPGANSIEIVRTGPTVAGTSYWVTFDYVRMEIDSGGNEPPAFAPTGDLSVREGERLNFVVVATDGDVPPTPLTFALLSGPVGLTMNAFGVVEWTPTEEQGPSANPVVVKVTDNGVPPKSTTNTLTVIAQEVNLPPVLAAVESQTIPEQVPWSAQLSASDADLPANVLTYALVDGPGGMVVSPDGLVTWTPSEAQGPSVNVVTVNVTDGGSPALSATWQFTLTVTEVNRSPELTEVSLQEVDELGLFELQLQSTDPDLPGNQRTFGLVNGPSGMTVTPQGLLQWIPSEGQAPSLNTVVVVVRDDGSPVLTATREFSVRVREVNAAPVLNTVADRRMLESERLELNLTAADPDFPANLLRFSLVSGPSGLSVSELGLLVWEPTEPQGPSVNRVVVRVTDNGEPPLSGTTEFTVTVDEVNRPPVLKDVADLVIEERREWSLALSVEDPDIPANLQTFTLLRGPDGMTLSPEGVLRWMPSEGQGPSVNEVTVKVTDNGMPNLSATNRLNVVVTEVNSAPRFRLLSGLTVDELVRLNVSLVADDDDLPANTLTFTLINGPSGLTVDPSGSIAWTPREDQGPSTNTVTIQVTDDGVPPLVATGVFTIVVREVNTAPVLRPVAPQVTDELAGWAMTLSASDGDLPPNRLRFALVGGPSGLTVTDDGLVRWSPAEDQGPSTNSVVVRVTDDGVPPLVATGEFTIVVREVNSAPVLRPVAQQVTDELAEWETTLSATDSDLPPNGLRFALVSGPSGLTVSGGGLVHWSPTEEQGPSTQTVVVRVFDDGTPSAGATNQFTIVVREVNTAPVLLPLGSQSVGEMTLWSRVLRATDSDLPATPLTFSLVSGPPGLTVDSGGVVSWTPSEVQGPSTNRVMVRVTDTGPGLLSATNQFTVTVLEVNQAPLINEIEDREVFLGESVVIPIRAVDPDLPANSLTFDLISGPTGGFLNALNEFRWVADEEGSKAVLVRVTDDGSPPEFREKIFMLHVVPLHLEIRVNGDQAAVVFETRSGWTYRLFALPYSQAGDPFPKWQPLKPSGINGTGARQEYALPSGPTESGRLIRMTAAPTAASASHP